MLVHILSLLHLIQKMLESQQDIQTKNSFKEFKVIQKKFKLTISGTVHESGHAMVIEKIFFSNTLKV